MKIFHRLGNTNSFPSIHKDWLNNDGTWALNDFILEEDFLKAESYELNQWKRKLKHSGMRFKDLLAKTNYPVDHG